MIQNLGSVVLSSRSNSKGKCQKECEDTSGCVAFDFTTNSKNSDACRGVSKIGSPRYGGGGADKHQFCILGSGGRSGKSGSGGGKGGRSGKSGSGSGSGKGKKGEGGRSGKSGSGSGGGGGKSGCKSGMIQGMKNVVL